MKLELLIDELQEIIDSGFTMPLSGGKMVVNTERIKEIIDEMRTNMPQEVRQAKEVAADRSKILAMAKEEAEGIVQKAEDRAKAMLDHHDITKRASQRAEEIIADANAEASKIRNDANAYDSKVRGSANAYIDRIMKKADEELSANLAELKKTRQSLKSFQQQNTGSQQRKTKKPSN